MTVYLDAARDSDESGEESKVAARGAKSANGFAACENFAMIYGGCPDLGVPSKTTMIQDVADIFSNEYNRDTVSILFPNCFDNLELVASNTL